METDTIIAEPVPLSKGERREQEILQTAADMFFQKGFHATSLEDIARVVGIRKAGLYYYAQTKDELLFRIVQRGMEMITAELQAICDSEDSPAEKLRRAVENHAAATDSRGSMMGVILREDRSIAPQYREEYLAMRDTYETIINGIVREGIAKSDFRPCDPDTVTRAILGMCGWLSVWYRPDGRLSPAGISNEFTQLILQGLRCPSS